MKMDVNIQQDLVPRRQMTLEEVKKLTPARLENSGFHLTREIYGDGNCYVNSILHLLE